MENVVGDELWIDSLVGELSRCSPRNPEDGHWRMPDDLVGAGSEEHARDRSRLARTDHQHVTGEPFDVLEGLLPLVAPRAWRGVFKQMIELRDGQIRFIGLASVVVGGVMLVMTR